MEIINYEQTLEELRNFETLDLNNILSLEMNIKDASTEDLVKLYEILEQTKQNLLKMRELLYNY
ncbi:MAG: hypothetical protein E7311_02900 [Clostridiales bacterium]|nr:hypothetical protein [Clostridiales bacterium]